MKKVVVFFGEKGGGGEGSAGESQGGREAGSLRCFLPWTFQLQWAPATKRCEVAKGLRALQSVPLSTESCTPPYKTIIFSSTTAADWEALQDSRD